MAQNIVIYAALATPANAAFSTATTGGTLAAGTYFYRVSAIDSTGGETLASAETSQVTTGATSTVTVNWGAVSGATGYKVYGRTTGAELLIATVGAVTTYTDTGSITPAGALPSANTTGSGRVKSASISVPSNSSYTFGIYVDSGSLKPGQRAVLYVDTPGADTVETELDYSKPHQSITGPTKIVMERVEASAPFACYYQDS